MRPIVGLGQDGCRGQAGAASGSPHQVLGTHSSDIPSSDVTNIKNTGGSVKDVLKMSQNSNCQQSIFADVHEFVTF